MTIQKTLGNLQQELARDQARRTSDKSNPGELESLDTSISRLNSQISTLQNNVSTAASTAAATAATAAANQTQLQSAKKQISTFLSGVPGLSQLDPTNALSSWMVGQAQTLAGLGMSPSDILNTIESTINQPSNDPTALAVFNSIFPGYNEKIQAGTTNAMPGGGSGILGYIQYANQIQQYAQTAKLTPGTITAQDIGSLWAGDVSANEVSDRLTMAASNANLAMSNPAVGTFLQSQGLNSSTLTSYYLNPANTLQSINAVNTGIGGAESGFGQMSDAQAASLASFLANPGTNGVAAVTTQQAEGQLTQNLGNGMTSAAGMANAGFETAGLGTSGSAANPGVVSGNQILGAVEGNQADVVAARRATETRTAGSSGGGGFAAGNQGVSGAGYGSQ